MLECMETVNYNNNIRAYWTRPWLLNAVLNYPSITALFEHLGRELCIISAPRVKDVPALILGSGPSLEKTLAHIRGWTQGAIFCSPSQCHVLDAIGRHPDYIMVLDASHRHLKHLQKGNFWHSALVAHPSVAPEILEYWKYRRYFFRMYEPENQPVMALYDSIYPWLIGHIVNSGSVVNNMILLAHQLGYSPIFLCGVDYGFPNKQYRFRDVDNIAPFAYEPEQMEMISKQLEDEKMLSINNIITSPVNIFYKLTMLVNWKLMSTQLISCSEGIITELPKADIEQVVKQQGRGFENLYMTPEQIDEKVDHYSIPRGVYGVRKEGLGVQIVTSLQEQIAKVEKELEGYKKVMAQWSFDEKQKEWSRIESPVMSEKKEEKK